MSSDDARESGDLEVMVSKIIDEAFGVKSFELVDRFGKTLPSFSAGSHVDVKIPGGYVRQYSLSNDPKETNRYVIGVLCENMGRGGSRALHERIRVGDTLLIGRPRNNFSLCMDAKRHVLIAGGIGVTPLKSMVHTLLNHGADFELHYCAKTPDHAAFKVPFGALERDGRVFMHYDHGDPSRGLDIPSLLARSRPGDHLYYCGPGGFMAACAAASDHWPTGTVHCEHFKAPDVKFDNVVSEEPCGFKIKIASTGEVLAVGEEQSIADVLAANGYGIETSCEAGLCATCKLRYLEGKIDHRDFILDDEERGEYLTACVSRGVSEMVVIDL
ncbi:PDR/VanB family oxidoreductase [Alloalcanivorax sp. C16-2]|uniref:PDR/VanB family oxidoreductase n=1 Tax=Alloalcanivorax sp. C16-2 TaxID=3390052 RepID=UPI003970FC2F